MLPELIQRLEKCFSSDLSDEIVASAFDHLIESGKITLEDVDEALEVGISEWEK